MQAVGGNLSQNDPRQEAGGIIPLHAQGSEKRDCCTRNILLRLAEVRRAFGRRQPRRRSRRRPNWKVCAL